MVINIASSRPPMLDDSRGGNRTLFFRSLVAAGSGIAGKVLGLVKQIVSVALISSALGAEGLQEQMLAIAFVSWFNLTLCGTHTALPILLIRSGANTEAFASIAKTAYLIAVIGAFCALGLTFLVLKFGLMEGQATAPIATAAICNAATIVFNLSEKVF